MSTIFELAYHKYQLSWMLNHSFSLKTLMDSLTDYQYRDPEDSDAISEPVRDIFSSWEYDRGFDGELWACSEEFAENEYLDTEYMRNLLTTAEFAEYQKDKKSNKGE